MRSNDVDDIISDTVVSIIARLRKSDVGNLAALAACIAKGKCVDWHRRKKCGRLDSTPPQVMDLHPAPQTDAEHHEVDLREQLRGLSGRIPLSVKQDRLVALLLQGEGVSRIRRALGNASSRDLREICLSLTRKISRLPPPERQTQRKGSFHEVTSLLCGFLDLHVVPGCWIVHILRRSCAAGWRGQRQVLCGAWRPALQRLSHW